MKHVFIIGSKGIPAKYGGFETFVDELVSQKKSPDIKYHVACMDLGAEQNKGLGSRAATSSNADDTLNSGENQEKSSESSRHFEYHDADCFNVRVPNVGPAKAVLYDLKAIKAVTRYAEENDIRDGVLYILACRIGPFMQAATRQLRQRGFKIYVNPDGHEWLRAKWNAAIKKYWKKSEALMVKHADLLICDSKNIEQYIQKEYAKYSPQTTFISYGADTQKSGLNDNDKELQDWYKKFDVKPGEYYLVVGRFVPENNYETIIRELMQSKSQKDLVIVTNVEHNKFYDDLLEKTHFDQDKRIKFVGTVYDKELIKKIRELSHAYIHGHSVGGTNPSLLEALASTGVNVLYECGFNREVAEDGALYFSKEAGNLATLIDKADKLSAKETQKLSKAAKRRIDEQYSWDKIVKEYEDEFEG